MGSLARNNYSWIDTAIVANGNNWCVSWTNDSGETRKVESITATMGTGNGTYQQYDTGASATGTGKPIKVRLKAVYGSNTNYSDYQTISKAVGTQPWSGGITSTVRTDGVNITWNFDSLIIANGTTVTFYFNNPDPSSGAVLCCNFDNLDDDDIMPPKPATYTVKYNANGGTGAPSSQTKTAGVALTLSSTKPTKSYSLTYNANNGSLPSGTTNPVTRSCTFNKWNTKADGTGTSYNSGGSYTTDADVTLYAQWTDPTLGTLPTPTRSGYRFLGWFTASSGGSQVTSSTTISSDTTIYAHWIERVTLSYNTSGGSTAPASQEYDKGSTATVTSNKPTKSVTLTYNANGGTFNGTGSGTSTKSVSLVFKGWATSSSRASAGTVDYSSGDTFVINSNTTLYAVWGASAIGTLPTVGTGTAQIAARTGYRLDTGKPWTSTKNGSTAVTSSTTISSDTTIYALWEYRVVFNANGGSFTSSDASQQGGLATDTVWKKHGQAIEVYHDAVRLGYSVLGWNPSSSATAKSYDNISDYDISEQYFPGEQVVYNGKLYECKKGTSNPAGSFNSNYWTDKGSASSLVRTYTANSPTTLYIIWKILTYTVTFKTGFGNNVVIKKVTGVQYGSSVPTSAVPIYGVTVMTNGKVFKREGPYGFVGWSGSINYIVADTFIEALWEFSPIWIVIDKNGSKTWVPYKPEED